jgi:DNA-binding transcriptional LysR family regulator
MLIETLKVFCDLVETASFSGAAERNRLTQSAVSQKVRALESGYGVVMVERGAGRPFRLTPEGQLFYESCRELLAIYDAIPSRLLKVAGDLTGEVHVATVPGLGLYDLADARRRFRRQYRGVRVSVDYTGWNEAYDRVREKKSDFALLAYPEERPGFEVEVCWQEKLVLVCPLNHRLARYGTVAVKDLKGERLVVCAPDDPTAEALERAFCKAKIEVVQVFEVRNSETALRAVEVESALTILPARQAPEQPEVYRVVEINSTDMWRPVGIIRRAGESIAPAAGEFIRSLKESR